jgi:hypothetical protein
VLELEAEITQLKGELEKVKEEAARQRYFVFCVLMSYTFTFWFAKPFAAFKVVKQLREFFDGKSS